MVKPIVSTHQEATQTFYAHGKLLITGEYLVVAGAKALAIPVRFGQQLQVIPVASASSPQLMLTWEQYDHCHALLFSAQLLGNTLAVVAANHNEKAKLLQKTLLVAKKLNKNFLATPQALYARSGLGFNTHWGLGSSATFIANIAAWAQIDAFVLGRKIFGGSGYDIACAQASHPIFYQCNGPAVHYEKAMFYPSFQSQLFFVYLGKKVSSQQALAAFQRDAHYSARDVQVVTDLTNAIASTQKLDDFNYLLKEHERILAKILQQKSVKEIFFPDYPGALKSLGAWGGDFMLATTTDSAHAVDTYFKRKGFHTIIPYQAMALPSF